MSTTLRSASDFPHFLRRDVGAPHNNLRISRILKSLSEFGLERYNAGFLLFVLSEQSGNNILRSDILVNSMDRWWANCVRNHEERAWINDTIQKARSGSAKFIFTEETYREALQRRKETGKLQG